MLVKKFAEFAVRVMENVELAIQGQFTDENAKQFLNLPWRTKRLESGQSATGFCYLASWAYYVIMSEQAVELTVKKWRNPQNAMDGHFWVEQNGKVIDLTKDQYLRKGSTITKPASALENHPEKSKRKWRHLQD